MNKLQSLMKLLFTSAQGANNLKVIKTYQSHLGMKVKGSYTFKAINGRQWSEIKLNDLSLKEAV